MLVNSLAHAFLAAVGLSAVRSHQTYEANIVATLKRRNIDLVIDVGANVGQYARMLRNRGYAGKIFSVEPQADAYASLERSMRGDRNWAGLNAAVGTETARAKFNVSADSVCSSLLEPTQLLLDTIPSASVVKTIDVDVVRIDEIHFPPFQSASLKLDVQGFEREALGGASELINRFDVLEIELGLKPSYKKGFTLASALPELMAMGYSITSIGRGVSDPATGQLIDMDVLLERRNE